MGTSAPWKNLEKLAGLKNEKPRNVDGDGIRRLARKARRPFSFRRSEHDSGVRTAQVLVFCLTKASRLSPDCVQEEWRDGRRGVLKKDRTYYDARFGNIVFLIHI